MSPPPKDPSVPASFETLGEHYHLVEKLGEGAFGVVYRAHHDLLNQDFAVKILKPELCEDQDLRERFLDEARALIRFSHPNVVQMRHVGEQNGRLYLVMDLVRGEGLNDIIRRRGALSEDRAVDFMVQVLAGLEAAHAAGIVHRDLKPGNLIVDRTSDGSERIRVLDFGLSKLSALDGVAGAHRSVTGAIIGTLAYMSPEQLSGESDIDARSDVFAAGLILHEMLNGRHPYPGDSGIVVAAKLLRESVPDLEPKRAAKLKDSTRASLRQALERDRDARFTTAFAFAQSLEGKGPPSDTSRVTTIEEARRELARAEAREAQSKKKGGSLGKILASAAVVLVVAGVAGFLATRPKDDGGGGTPVAQQPPEGTPTVGTPTVSPPPPPPPVRPAPAPVPAPGPAPGPSEPPPPEDAPAVEPPVEARIAPEEPAVVPEEPAVTQPPPRESVPAEPVPAEPAPAEPVSVPPEEPAPVPPSVSPRELALAKTQVGAWTEARDAWAATLQADARDVLALRGTAMTWMRAADALARKGDIASALASFDGLIAYLTKIYETVYEPAAGEAKDALRVPMGFALTHRGEAHTERARWLRVQGNTAAEQQAMTQAEADLRLAVQFLDHDGESFWDFLLRRSEFRRLRGDAKQYIQDVAATTAVNSELVPARMWVAHFVGLRRQAEHALLPKQGGNRPRRGGARADAAASRMAEEALQVAKRGVQWTRVRGEPFTRIQWLEAGRVLVVKEMTLEPAEDRTALHGLLKWYLEQARVQPAPPWESGLLAKARLKPLEAALALMDSRVLERRAAASDSRGRGADASALREKARQQRDAALQLAQEGVALREQVALTTGELPEAWPHVMLAYALQAAGQAPEARKVLQQGIEAARKNPESGPMPCVVCPK